MSVPGRTYFCGKALHEAPVSICIRILHCRKDFLLRKVVFVNRMYISIIKWVKGHWQQFVFGGIFRVDHVNTIPWWAIFTRRTSAHFSKMIWFISCTSHLSKCRTFGALFDVDSSAVFFNDLTDLLQVQVGLVFASDHCCVVSVAFFTFSACLLHWYYLLMSLCSMTARWWP